MAIKHTCLASAAILSIASLMLAGCGGSTATDTPRVATGTTNLSGLWRVTQSIMTTTQRTAVTVVDNGGDLTLNDCNLGFRNYALTRSGNELAGYYFNLAPIMVTDNEHMTYDYSNIHRDFEKMDKDAVYDMGTFSVSSPAFTTINANASDVCVGFADSGSAQSLILSTRINGELMRVTVNLSNSLRVGSFAVEPFGNAPATVTLDGNALQPSIGVSSAAVLQGTLKITKRTNVWVEGTVTGILDDNTTNVDIAFSAEMP